MNSGISENLGQVLSKDLNRKTLYKLFIKNNVQSDDIDTIDSEIQPSEVRYKAEKLLFLNLLMDYDLENLMERGKNVKYDYMIGLLLYLVSDSHFKYSFGYFKESIQIFDKMLVQWSEFLNAVIADVTTLPPINLRQSIVVEFDEILNITLLKDVICTVKIDMNNFDRLFRKKSRTYDFSIMIDGKVLEAGKSN